MKRVAVSNLAWPASFETQAIELLPSLGFDGLELAPGKTFPEWLSQKPDIGEFQARIAGQGLTVVALQSILYGASGVELFASAESRRRLADHLSRVARLAGSLGARACVYGAPATRDPGSLPLSDARDIAVEFFTGVAPAFQREGTCLTFEANDESYGCRFVTRTSEAIDLVRRIDHPGVRLQFDTGTVFLGDEPMPVVAMAAGLAGHAHVSEPGLKPIGTVGSDHAKVAATLRSVHYDGWISVEMSSDAAWEANLREAAAVMATVYRPSEVLR